MPGIASRAPHRSPMLGATTSGGGVVETPEQRDRTYSGRMNYISLSRRRAAAVLCCSAAGLAIALSSACAAHAALVPDTKVIVRTLTKGHGQPADGTQVTVSRQDRRVFANARIGFALVSVRGELLPARTTDGGRIWRIDGPGLFAEGAADAAVAVSNLGAEDASTFYAYGGGQVVDITSDGGLVWRQAIFQGLEAGVSPIDHGLAAYVDQSNSTGTQGITIQFYTTNGGRRWRVIKGYNF